MWSQKTYLVRRQESGVTRGGYGWNQGMVKSESRYTPFCTWLLCFWPARNRDDSGF